MLGLKVAFAVRVLVAGKIDFKLPFAVQIKPIFAPQLGVGKFGTGHQNIDFFFHGFLLDYSRRVIASAHNFVIIF